MCGANDKITFLATLCAGEPMHEPPSPKQLRRFDEGIVNASLVGVVVHADEDCSTPAMYPSRRDERISLFGTPSSSIPLFLTFLIER